MTEKLSVLFVDDEPNVLQGIRRATRHHRNDWEMEFVESGPAALEFLAGHDVDIVVSDILMPGMDGTELLQQVKSLHPRAARIILSGYAEEEAVFRSTRVAHRFLHKPCELDELQRTIQEIIACRDSVGEERIIDLVGRLDELPSLSEVYRELATAIDGDNWSPAGIAEIVSKDVGLTVELLRLVNSAFFGLRREVESVQEAVSYLGIEVVRGVVAGHSLFSDSTNDVVDVVQLGRRSTAIAGVARAWVRHAGGTNSEAACAYLAGMVHEVGTLALSCLSDVDADELRPVLHSNDVVNDRLTLGGVDRYAVASYLLGLWGFPAPSVAAVASLSQPAIDDTDPVSVGLKVASRGAQRGLVTTGSDQADAEAIEALIVELNTEILCAPEGAALLEPTS